MAMTFPFMFMHEGIGLNSYCKEARGLAADRYYQLGSMPTLLAIRVLDESLGSRRRRAGETGYSSRFSACAASRARDRFSALSRRIIVKGKEDIQFE